MRFNNIAILTTEDSWFVPHAKRLVDILVERGFNSGLFFRHEDVAKTYEVVLILSFFRLVPESFLNDHRHNLVVHPSNLPEGKGWSPLFWQILEGKDEIPIVLFEAAKEVDAGDIYLRDTVVLEGHELYEDIRRAQAEKIIELTLRFLEEYDVLNPKIQIGEESFYKRRTPKDNELDLDKSVREQFNLLRISNNNSFPAFFSMKGYKYTLKITKEKLEA